MVYIYICVCIFFFSFIKVAKLLLFSAKLNCYLLFCTCNINIRTTCKSYKYDNIDDTECLFYFTSFPTFRQHCKNQEKFKISFECF